MWGSPIWLALPAVLVLVLLVPQACSTGERESDGPQETRNAQAEPLPPPDRTGTSPWKPCSSPAVPTGIRRRAPEPIRPGPAPVGHWGHDAREPLHPSDNPSAGALYHLNCIWLQPRPGSLRPRAHALVWLKDVDARADLSAAALGQVWVARAPAVIVIAAEPQRTRVKYGERADRT